MAPQAFSPEVVAVLVARAQEGETEAFGRIYDGYLTPIYRYVVFRFPEELAEDLVADIFVKAWEKLHTYKVRSGIPFSAWLFRIARYTVIDAYRRQRGFLELNEEWVDEDTENDPKERAERRFAVARVRRALGELPRYYREILLLHYVADLSHSEVARSMRMTEGAVRVLKFRALRKLEAKLREMEPSSLPTEAPVLTYD